MNFNSVEFVNNTKLSKEVHYFNYVIHLSLLLVTSTYKTPYKKQSKMPLNKNGI